MEGTGAHILIAEDDADINRLLTTLLSKEGYAVTPAYSGSEADMRLQAERYDLVLLDLMLPGLSGSYAHCTNSHISFLELWIARNSSWKYRSFRRIWHCIVSIMDW